MSELTGMMRATNQRLTDLQHRAQQPHLTVEADVKSNMKARKRTEGAVADRAKHGDSSYARAVDGPTSLTSFGIITELLSPGKCIGDALVNNGAETSKPHLPPAELCMLSSAAGGLTPAGTVSTAIRANVTRPLPSWTPSDKNQEENQPDKRQLACPFLLEESHRNRIKANSGV